MSDSEGLSDSENASTSKESHELVRLQKPVVFNTERGRHVDKGTISPRFYNCFNYSLLPKTQLDVHLVVGVTSANKGEGKTVVAANLAVSLALASQSETILVDLNLRSPRIHTIFGTKLNPGVTGALVDPTIQVSLTQIKHLYVLPAGNVSGGMLFEEAVVSLDKKDVGDGGKTPVSLDSIAEFRDVFYSLRREFEFVIVDMPSIQEPRVPSLISHVLDGALVVVDANKTKHEDIERLFRRINEQRVFGFVMNHGDEELE
jgi:Mrp family chromosome partitioning ATPase